MFSWLRTYTRWIHTGQPAGTIEPLPEVSSDGSTSVDGLWVCGDLTGTPLLKFAADGGARIVDRIVERGRRGAADGLDLVIVGGGVSGMSAALRAREAGLDFVVLESREPFATIADFPARKPIYTYPKEMEVSGALSLDADVKEDLLEELRSSAQSIDPVREKAVRVRREEGGLRVECASGASFGAPEVLVAIGRSGEYRNLDVPGAGRDHVHHRLHDPNDFRGDPVVVVGGGDTAAEAAVALAGAGAQVTLVHRGERLVRPREETRDRVSALADEDQLELLMSRTVQAIHEDEVEFDDGSRRRASTVFVMIGREAPLDFFRRSGVGIRGDWTPARWLGLAALLLAAFVVYHWKSDSGPGIQELFRDRGWFPFSIPDPASPAHLLGTLRLSAQAPAFWYSLAYAAVVVVFGVLRIRRRRTPYITRQTLALMAIQVLPLFLLPFVILPWMGHNGFFESGVGRALADELFPRTEWDPNGREYWRSVGFILAWPLMIWNVFSDQPLRLWLAISFLQTFVIIPLLVYRWGKGAYCGWICSCGALAETLGDTVRDRMPHGPGWNRLNMLGQGILAIAFLLLALRILGWALPGTPIGSASREAFMVATMGRHTDWTAVGGAGAWLNYAWVVDLLLAGILGVGLYAHFSGRTWCRFGCPLAALMHVYVRMGTRFRIFADAKRCISCNLCTTHCHQGIDVMHFAQRGAPMEDPQCVRCSACVQVCPTRVLEFGSIDPRSGEEAGRDRWPARS